MISDKFFEVKTNNLYGDIVGICDIFEQWYFQELPGEEDLNHYEEIMDCYAAFEAYLITNQIKFQEIKFTETRVDNIKLVGMFFQEFQKEYSSLMEKHLASEAIEMARNKYKQKFKIGFGYEFTDGDLKRIQTLLNELRDYIHDSKEFDANHKERILNRLEKLQEELHKRVSSLDKFWGLVGDAGVAIGKFGKDAKPFVDRIREITQIVWNTQARAEELPSGMELPLMSEKIERE